MAEGGISVYGGFPAEGGIENVCAALQNWFPRAPAQVLNLGEELGPTLHFRTGNSFFATLFMEEEDAFLLDGGVQGSLEEAVALVRRMSECLAGAGLEHGLHVAEAPMVYAASFVYPPA